MSYIIYVTNKKTNTKYAYQSESYRDPVTRQPRSRRTYLGRVDPVTNEIIPKAEKGRRNRKPATAQPTTADTPGIDVQALKKQVRTLEIQQREIKQKVLVMDELIESIHDLLDKGST